MSVRREVCMLAHTFDPNKHRIDNWYASEKLDGVRVIWDGGLSRGLLASEVPFAHIEKHKRYVNPVYATGLWTRLLQPLQAPDFFLDKLPPFPLDGELFIGRGKFQETISTVRKLIPVSDEWAKICYCIFDIIALVDILKPGRINVPLIKDMMITEEMYIWAINRLRKIGLAGKRPKINRFNQYVDYIKSRDWMQIEHERLIAIPQRQVVDVDEVMKLLEQVVRKGGEGLILRNPNSVWEPKRSNDLLKVKQTLDSEGIVVGYIGGKITDRGSKLSGLMGALIIEWEGKRFELSGMTDQERQLVYSNGLNAYEEVKKYDGQQVPSNIVSRVFPRGSVVRFKYADLSSDGVPRFARYWR